jgi:hypothetical protein
MPMTAQDILNREYLEMRAKILQLAASLDRLDRADGSVNGDVRMSHLNEGIEILQSDSPGRAERIQMLFSRPFSDNWRDEFQLASK